MNLNSTSGDGLPFYAEWIKLMRNLHERGESLPNAAKRFTYQAALAINTTEADAARALLMSPQALYCWLKRYRRNKEACHG